MTFSPVLSAVISTPAGLLWQSPFCLRPGPGLSPSAAPLGRRLKKKGAPTCAGAPQRSGHCRVCARTVVLNAASFEAASRENLHVVGALRVLGDVEAFAFGLDIGTQADDDIDDLVEDRRADARPHQRGADAPALRDHLRSEVVVGDLAGGVVHDAGAAERRVHQDPGAERADNAADAVDAEP